MVTDDVAISTVTDCSGRVITATYQDLFISYRLLPSLVSHGTLPRSVICLVTMQSGIKDLRCLYSRQSFESRGLTPVLSSSLSRKSRPCVVTVSITLPPHILNRNKSYLLTLLTLDCWNSLVWSTKLPPTLVSHPFEKLANKEDVC